MQITYFLAQVIGLYVLIVGLTMLFWKARWMHVIRELCRSENQTLMYVLGMLALPVGLLLVVSHNYWSMGVLPFVVTLFGWVVLLKSVLVFVLSPEQIARLVKMSMIESWWYAYVVVILVVGAYLAHAGFTQTGLFH